MSKNHFCTGTLPSAHYGEALYECGEDEGRLWVRNDEYTSQVNYCPYCGYKAPRQLHSVYNPDAVLSYPGDQAFTWQDEPTP